ncbi:MAG: hypothetical protein K2X69_07645 [Silvanigrellaceae bacterium]|nr:hypothetical protein [Silvanigrellaceae bacterium]
MKVFVYWNIKKGLWSIRALQGENKGRVIERQAEVHLANCLLTVSEKGRLRVLKEKSKNVHAGIVGELVEPFSIDKFFNITYNPYKYSSFVKCENKEPIHTAQLVKMNQDRSVQVII